MDNSKQVQKALRDLERKHKRNMIDAMKSVVNLEENSLKQNAPKDTEHLAQSVKSKVTEANGVILGEVTAGYEGLDILAIEYGSERHAPSGFFRRSIDSTFKQCEAIIDKAAGK